MIPPEVSTICVSPSCFSNQTVLITGGCGSLGRRLTREMLKPKYLVKTIRVLDINENMMAKLRREMPSSQVRWLLGNIENKERMIRAMENVDIVIHLVAQKHVDLAETNPFYSVMTNVIGTQVCIDAALAANVNKFLYFSSDKAVYAVGTYGRCKALSESLTLDAKNYKGDRRTIFSVARPPNYFNSDGSVFEVWQEQKQKNLPLTVTSEKMERYFMSFADIVNFTLKCVKVMKGGEIFVPIGAEKKRVIDLARKISDNIKITGMRPGERLTEHLMTEEEMSRAKKVERMWVIK